MHALERRERRLVPTGAVALASHEEEGTAGSFCNAGAACSPHAGIRLSAPLLVEDMR